MLRTAFYATVAALAVAAPVRAQTESIPPSDYALLNARIVVSPGRVIERGTLHMSGGRIVAVGERVNVPATAIQLDLGGKTVYPGLIDAATSIGLPAVLPAGGGGRRGGGPAPGPSMGSAERGTSPPEVRPEQQAADVFAPSDAQLQAMRAAGVTALGLAFDASGIFPGQTTAVSTKSGDAPNLVLRTPVAMQVTFGRRRGAYPGTLMGTMAYIKQALYDAEHQRRVGEAFQRNPATAPRPTYDAQARALGPVVTGTLPVWFFASGERDLARTIELANEMRIQNYTIVGAQEGYRAADLLKTSGKPVIVSLDYPDANAITGRAFELHVAPPSGEDTEGARADSAALRAARGNAAALQRAGVPLALASHGLDGGAAFRTAILGAVEAGLSADDALRALTVTPARLLGLENVLGTIEPGKFANLVIVEGDLFSRQGRIREVFVEGERFEIRETERPAQRGGRAGGAGAAGEWTGSIEGPGGMMAFTLTIRVEGQTLSGSLATEMGVTALTGELTGDDVVLRGTATPPGMNAIEISITGRITGDDLRGTLVAQGMAEVPFNARRRTPGGNPSDAMQGGRS